MKNRNVLYCLILVVTAVALYSQSIVYGFSYFDDQLLILQNSDQFFKPFALSDYFLSSSNMGGPDAFYRPLQNLSFWVDARIGGMDAWPFHLHNILLFAAVVVALYHLLRQLTLSSGWAFSAALLYAVHPMFVSAVGWIPARGDLQLALLAFLSFSAYIQYLDTRKLLYLAGAMLAWLFALMAKETAVVLPVIFAGYTYLFKKTAKQTAGGLTAKSILQLLVGTGLLFVIWLGMRWVSTDSSGMQWNVILRNLQHFPVLFQQSFIPYDGNTVPMFTLVQVLIGIGILLALFFVYYRSSCSKENRRLFWLGVLFVFFGILPVLLSQIELLYHRFLLPFPGLILMTYALIPQKIRTASYLKYIGLGIGIACVTLALLRMPNYTDYESFYGKAITQSTQDLEQYYLERGKARQEHKKLIEALEDYDAAIAADPNFDKPYVLRGILRAGFKDVEGGILDLTKAIEIAGPKAELFYDRAGFFTTLEKGELAIADYDKAIELNPKFSLAYNNRANLFLNMKMYDQALRDYNTAIQLDPEYVNAYVNRALTYFQQNNIPASLTDINSALIRTRGAREKAMLYFRKAQLEFQLEKYYNALNSVNSCLRISGEDPVAIQLLEDIRKKIQ